MKGTGVHAPPPPPLCARAVHLRARPRSETELQRAPERADKRQRGRKMEVRVGEKLLCLAVLSSVFLVDSVLGKYVKGIVNTKEVSAVIFLFSS